ncbi:MAG: DUF5110 domain-containing protein, partial [Anaerolineae bacterium]|nr:DUF5110 domain-containing protein [Anaerolineae bacterium]
AEPDDLRQVYVFPYSQSGQGTFTLIEDDGITIYYQRGEFTEVTLQVIAEPNEIALDVNARGNFPLPYASIEFILPHGETRRVKARGEEWRDEQGRRHIRVDVESK